MTTKELVVAEFEKRVFEESYERIYSCLRMLNDEQIWHAPNTHVPAVGNLILHLCGNARQWILSGIGQAVDNRNREEEFKLHSNIKKSDFVFLLENLRTNLKETLTQINPNEIDKPTVVQGFEVTYFSIIIHVLEHFSYHTGQITTLTKIIKNQPTNYYKDFNLNKNNPTHLI